MRCDCCGEFYSLADGGCGPCGEAEAEGYALVSIESQRPEPNDPRDYEPSEMGA